LRSSGPYVVVPPNAVTPICLVLHELATNATKYGGFSDARAYVSVSWEQKDSNELYFRWTENVPEYDSRPPKHTGFGTRLMDLTARQLGATLLRSWNENGLSIDMRLQLAADE
jgi:two-component sensor histidine kinase